MKKILALVFVLSSSQAFATKARTTALMNSFHLVDTQTEFSSPYHMFSIPDFVSFESGKTTATSTSDNAEALTKFSLNDSSKLLVAIGHKDETVQSQRRFLNAAAGTTYVSQQNPVEVIYGIKDSSGQIWSIGGYYSQFKDKIADNNEGSAGLRLAASHGDFKWKLNLGITNKVQNTTDGTFTNQPYGNLGLRYQTDSHNKFAFDYTTWKVKMDAVNGTETQSHDYQNIKLQYVNTVAQDGNDLFFGISIDSTDLKNKINDKKLTRLALPVWMGFEYNANEMFTLRGSIKQTLFAQSKDENGYAAYSADGAFGGPNTEMAAEPNNTEVAVGLGWKFNKLIIDGTLAGLVNKASTPGTGAQQVNSNSLLAQAGVTYNF